MASVTAEQVLRRLAELELAAAQFYEGLLAGTKSKLVAKLAEMMIQAETRHRKRFLIYADRAAEKDDPNEYVMTETLPEHLVALLETNIWPSRKIIERSAKYSDDRAFIDFAIQAEEQSALLLTALRYSVPRKHQPYITRVIREEWGHKAKLEEIRERYFS